MKFSPSQEILLIHMGGLGDVCLSESAFYSLSLYYEGKITGLGIKRYLNLFSQYFNEIDDIESSRWLFLFSEDEKGFISKRIVFFGKDRDRSLRSMWQKYSSEEILFIDLYPEGKKIHVEDYHLLQLSQKGIPPQKKEISPNLSPLVILYPERARRKRKWEFENFLKLEKELKKRNIPTLWLKEIDNPSCDVFGVQIEDLSNLKDFLTKKGGIFVSNDSGVAHLAGACGLCTVTFFSDADPSIWHPRGINRSISLKEGELKVDDLINIISDLFSTYFGEF